MGNDKIIMRKNASEEIQLRTKKDIIGPDVFELHNSLEDLVFQQHDEFSSIIDKYDIKELNTFLLRIEPHMKRLMQIMYDSLPHFKNELPDLMQTKEDYRVHLGKGVLYTFGSLILGEFSRLYWEDVVYAIQHPLLDVVMYKPSDIVLGSLFGISSIALLYKAMRQYYCSLKILREKREKDRDVEKLLKRLEKMDDKERIDAVELMSFTLKKLMELEKLVMRNKEPERSFLNAYEILRDRLMLLRERDSGTREIIEIYRNKDFLEVVRDFLSHLGANYMFTFPNLFNEKMGSSDPIIYSQEFFRLSHTNQGFYTYLNACHAFLSIIEKRKKG